MQKARSEKGEVFLKPRAFKTGQRRALQRAKRLEKRRAEPLQRQRDAQAAAESRGQLAACRKNSGLGQQAVGYSRPAAHWPQRCAGAATGEMITWSGSWAQRYRTRALSLAVA